jgi:hypothetical protein
VTLHKATRFVGDRPIILMSCADDEVKARCCVPKDMISESFNAEKWLRNIGKVFKSTVEPPKGQNPLEVCIMKGRKVKPEAFNGLLEEAIASAKEYASSNYIDESSCATAKN